MTTFDQPSIDFDAASEPISGDTKATVELVGNDWLADENWRQFERAVRWVASLDNGLVDPNVVRHELSNVYGLVIEPRRYSAFWSRAASKSGFLAVDGWVTNDDARGGNRGKPLRRYRLRSQ